MLFCLNCLRFSALYLHNLKGLFVVQRVLGIWYSAIRQTVVRWGKDGAEFAILQQILFKLCQNVLAICEFAQRMNVRSNFMHKSLSLRRLRNVNHFLNYVISVLVLHHCVKAAVGPFCKRKYSIRDFWLFKMRKSDLRVISTAHFFNEECTFLSVRISHAFLNNVTLEFLNSNDYIFN